MRTLAAPLTSLLSVGALVVSLTACAPAGETRPDPTELATRYLYAIADGDAEAAAALDAHIVGEADEFTDTTTLRSNAVLGAAERIEDVELDPETTTAIVGDGVQATAVPFTATLAGEEISSFVAVTWDEEAGEWILADTLAQPLAISAQVDRAQTALVGFSVPGGGLESPVDQDGPVGYLAYPGVYSITADIDPASLVDPALGITRDAVVAPSGTQPTLVFEVTALP